MRPSRRAECAFTLLGVAHAHPVAKSPLAAPGRSRTGVGAWARLQIVGAEAAVGVQVAVGAADVRSRCSRRCAVGRHVQPVVGEGGAPAGALKLGAAVGGRLDIALVPGRGF